MQLRLAFFLVALLAGPALAEQAVVEVALGASHACARMRDGGVRCWGMNSAGQTGAGAAPAVLRPTPVLTGAVSLTAGTAHSCAVLADGSARCWGDDAQGRLGGAGGRGGGPVVVAGLADAVEIRAGSRHTCARRAAGTVVCWGANDRGQLGDGTVIGRAAPVAVAGLRDAVALSAGATHTCALVAGGAVRCWGDNVSHEIDDSETEALLVPTLVPGWRDLAQVAAGVRLTCARGRDHHVMCRGGTTVIAPIRDLPLRENVVWPTDATDLAVGAALGEQLSGGRHTFHACAVVGGGRVVCGDVTAGDVMLSRPMAQAPDAVPGIAGAIRVAVGAALACALLADGSVRCWGDNAHGELGGGVADTRAEPTPVAGLAGVAALALGSTHTCALLGDATVSCWGDDVAGALGDGGGPARARPRPVPALAGVRAIAAGDYHNCVLLVGGAVRCWGLDNAGQTGAEPRTADTSIVTVPGLDGVAQIAAAGVRSCARGDGGEVRCWGGPLPLTQNGSAFIPTRIPGLDGAAELSLGGHLGCVRRARGDTLCWDDNSIDEKTYQPIVAVPAPIALTAPSAGFAHICGLDGARRPLCTGDPTFGALGPDRELPWNVPGPLPGIARAARAVAGSHTNCALSDDGHARCWGLLPADLDGVADLALGGTHACARMRDGSVRCWGGNLAGQSGWGTPRDPAAPVAVRFAP